MRRRVLELILAAERPVGAYALLELLHAEKPRIRPPTIYRALEFLLENRITENLRRHGQELGFQIHRQVVELRGLCATCQQTTMRTASR
jgi:Fe2+ or Zn2+ uptake regulation protein